MCKLFHWLGLKALPISTTTCILYKYTYKIINTFRLLQFVSVDWPRISDWCQTWWGLFKRLGDGLPHGGQLNPSPLTTVSPVGAGESLARSSVSCSPFPSVFIGSTWIFLVEHWAVQSPMVYSYHLGNWIRMGVLWVCPILTHKCGPCSVGQDCGPGQKGPPPDQALLGVCALDDETPGYVNGLSS